MNAREGLRLSEDNKSDGLDVSVYITLTVKSEEITL
jgi:hypothetical protein